MERKARQGKKVRNRKGTGEESHQEKKDGGEVRQNERKKC